jgi:Domain of unknown function (DUF4388)
MALTGSLSEYSLAEILNFIERSQSTGLLSIVPDRHDLAIAIKPYYLWFDRGWIVGVTSGMNGQELLNAIWLRKILPSTQIDLLRTQVNQLSQPLGTYLKSRGLLNLEQLKLLFNSQVIAPVCKLFELSNGKFNLDLQQTPNYAEMTEISISAQELGLLGLRVLKNWNGLSAKLPHHSYALQRLLSQPPTFRLDRFELELFKLADGETPLAKLAQRMGVAVELAKQTGYRLSVFQLVRQIPTQLLAAPQPEQYSLTDEFEIALLKELDAASDHYSLTDEFEITLSKEINSAWLGSGRL